MRAGIFGISLMMMMALAGGLPRSLHAQDPPGPDAGQEELRSAQDRIEELEARVRKLEDLAFASAQLSVYDARRRLASAIRELEQNQRLFRRGLLLAVELDRSRYEADRARRELELARCQSGHYHLSAQIDILDAEYELKTATDALERTREAALIGQVSDWQLQKNEEAVERARMAMEYAQQKLDALGPPPSPADDATSNAPDNNPDEEKNIR